MNHVIVGDDSKVIVNGRVWTFGSVAGYAARNYLAQTANYNQSVRNYTQGWSLMYHIRNEVKRAVQNRHEPVWLNPDATVLTADVGERMRYAKLRETVPHLNLGDHVLLEGDVYELTHGNHSDHIKLVYVSTPNVSVSARHDLGDTTQAEHVVDSIVKMMAIRLSPSCVESKTLSNLRRERPSSSTRGLESSRGGGSMGDRKLPTPEELAVICANCGLPRGKHAHFEGYCPDAEDRTAWIIDQRFKPKEG